MSSPRELMRDIEHNDLESGEDILTPRDLWYQLCEMVEKQEEELDRFKNGFQGSCYACETVGMKNQELEEELKQIRARLEGLMDAYELIAMEKAELVELLEFAVGIQRKNYGNATDLHIAMIAWADKARSILAKYEE